MPDGGPPGEELRLPQHGTGRRDGHDDREEGSEGKTQREDRQRIRRSNGLVTSVSLQPDEFDARKLQEDPRGHVSCILPPHLIF